MNNFDMSFLPSIVRPLHLKVWSLKQIGYVGLGLGSSLLSITFGYPAHAQSASSSNVDVQFIPLPISNYDIGGLADRGAPDGREAAGTRGPCFAQFGDSPSGLTAGSPELTALLPTVPISYGDETVHTPMGSTTKPHPTFLFYMPYTQQVVDALQFTLMDAEDYTVANIDVPVPEQKGLLSVAWPMDQIPLETAVEYRWLLQVDCHNPVQPTDPFTSHQGITDQFTEDLVVEGFIRRFAMEPSSVIPEEDSLDTVTQLAASGVWNDALDGLIAQLSDHPQPDTISIALGQLLASVGLEDFTSYVDVEES